MQIHLLFQALPSLSAITDAGDDEDFRPMGQPIQTRRSQQGIPARGCSSGEHAGEADWYELERCVEWRWRNHTGPLFGCPGQQQGAWCAYDLRNLGFQPMVTWAAAQTAGADASGTQCGSFTPGLAIPVIEVQSVLTP